MKKRYVEPEQMTVFLNAEELLTDSIKVADQPGEEKIDDENQIEANSISIWENFD